MSQTSNNNVNVEDYLTTPEDVRAYLQAALDEMIRRFLLMRWGLWRDQKV